MIAVRRNIEKAARISGRRPADITLVCVTKQAAIEQIKEAIACGITDIGENRVQDAAEKIIAVGARCCVPLRWHLIGHLQTNKAKKAVEIFDLIHSIDSFHLAETVSKEAGKINKTQDILIEVNISKEESKFGVKPEETPPLIERIKALNNIRVLGLMTIAPLTDNPENARPCFRRLRDILRDVEAPQWGASTPQLSMGMSQDYQAAIEEGATMVRIGSAIFK